MFESLSQSLDRRRRLLQQRIRRTETGRPILLAFVFALLLVAAVVVLKRVVNTPLGTDAPFLFMLGSTMLVTWYGGRWAGVVAAVLGTLAVNYFFLPPFDDWHSTPAANEQTALFGAENLLVAWLTSLLVKARARAESGARRMKCMHAVSSATGNARTLSEAGTIIAREGTAMMGATAAAVFAVTDAPPALRLVAQFGSDPAVGPALVGGLREVPVDGPLPVSTAFKTAELLCVGKAQELRRRFPEFWALPRSEPPNRSLVCAPIRLDGETLGVLAFGFERDRVFSRDDQMLASSLALDCARAMDRVRLFEAERSARIEADRANRAKDEFLGIVSHELRTPLTAIAGWVHLLKRAPDRARQERGLEVIDRSVKEQTRIVEDVLDVSRIVRHELKIDHKPLDFAAAVRSVVDEMRPMAIKSGVELSLSSTGEAQVSGDLDRLRQVTRNLVGNGLKFTPRGGHVRVDVEVAPDKARLYVRDDGKGIAAEDLPLLFDIFGQVDSSVTRREGGLGLGLAIVRNIVEAHGGAARIESAGLGLGTMAVVELPLIRAVGTASGPAPSPTAVPSLASMRVLVVDDNPTGLESVSAVLVDAGAEVRGVRSAASALEELSGFTPDVLVSDISMPEHDGYWLIRKVRTLGTMSARVPAIALTAYASADGAKVAALAAGFQRHLTKPAEPAVLASTIVDVARHAA